MKRKQEPEMTSEGPGASSVQEMPLSEDPQLTLPLKEKTRPPPAAAAAPLPRSLQKFYQGEPVALGITQVLTGLFQISFGVLLQETARTVRFGSPALPMNLPVWAGAVCTISGSLSIITAAYPRMPLMKGGLVLNIVSALIAGVAGIIYLVTIVFHALAFVLVRCTARRPNCDTSRHYVFALSLGIFLLFLFLSTLQFCVSISSSAFGCKSLRQKDVAEEPVVLYQPVPAADKADVYFKSFTLPADLKTV